VVKCEKDKRLNSASDRALGCVEPDFTKCLLEGSYNFDRTIMTDVAMW
jgi:hypothetical protein